MAVIPYVFRLISASSIFKFHVLIAAIVMFNILKLIMKIMSNFPTVSIGWELGGCCLARREQFVVGEHHYHAAN
jgi:hypothetical protein